jgi:hypothetical protein
MASKQDLSSASPDSHGHKKTLFMSGSSGIVSLSYVATSFHWAMPLTELCRLYRAAQCLNNVVRVSDPTKNAALRHNHAQAHLLKFGKIRTDAILDD